MTDQAAGGYYHTGATRVIQITGTIGIIALMLAGLLVSGLSHAAEWALVTGDDYPPFTNRKADGGGIFTMITREAFASAGDSVVVTWRPWAKGFRDTAELRNDATFPYLRTKERMQKMLYSDPVLTLRRAIFLNREAGFVPETVNQLVGTVYCNPQGYADDRAIRDLRDQGKITRRTPRSIVKCFDLLVDRQVDFVAANERMGAIVTRRLGARGKVLHSVLLDEIVEIRLHLVVGKHHPRAAELLARFNRGLQTIRENGQFDAIIRQYKF